MPVDDAVWGVTTMVGLDPLYLANEGKFMAIAAEDQAPQIVTRLRQELGASQAATVGMVTTGRGNVYLTTASGGTTRLALLASTLVPRIC